MTSRDRTAFTLVELLVVIAIVSILAAMTATTRSVMLFEVGGVPVNLSSAGEGADANPLTRYFSASGNGLDNRLYAHADWSTGTDNTYATGYLGGRKPFNSAATQFPDPDGRHNSGSNFLLCDGHAKWMRGAIVSSGLNALGEQCLQDNINGIPGCGGQFYAAGTGAAGAFQATFTIR
jgi:prepilin-type N-terminal cleavage/methylation domain-containing protein/prepilin-type processing-associated H-X9-DG protein